MPDHRLPPPPLDSAGAFYQALVERAVDILEVLDVDQGEARYRYVSPSFTAVLGYSVAEHLTHTGSQLLHPDDLERTADAFRECTATPGHVTRVEARARHQDGQWVLLDLRFANLRDDPSVRGIVTVSQDISRRREIERALRNANAELERNRARLEAETRYLVEEANDEGSFDEIHGESLAIKAVVYQARQVAATDATVLLLGESGTGKDLMARAIHHASARRERPFVKVDCASLPANLVESELFGHDKGAFTGADTQRAGRFELAGGGTVFLDEIGELPLDLQSKLLRVLQERAFERLGGKETIHVDVRLVAATNRDLTSMVHEGTFREDLFYRINVFPISLPPLREREADIPILVRRLVDKLARTMRRHHVEIPPLVMERLQRYAWPGNVREMRNVLERALILSPGSILQLDRLDRGRSPPAASTDRKAFQPAALEDVERRHIARTLDYARWKVSGAGSAAELLAMNPSTLRARMRKLGITRSMRHGRMGGAVTGEFAIPNHTRPAGTPLPPGAGNTHG